MSREFTSQYVPAKEALDFDADRPAIVSKNILRDPSAVAEWASQSIANTVASGPDVITPLRDGYTSRQGTPGMVSAYLHLFIDFDDPVEFNTVAIMNHNLAGSTVKAGAFNGNSLNVGFDFGIAEDSRLVSVRVDGQGSPITYTSNNFYLTIEGATEIPKIGEIFVGKRTQLPRKASRPYSVDGKINSAATFESSNGAATKYNFYTGKSEFEQSFTSTTPEEHQKFQEIATGSSFGANQVIWIEDPKTNLSAARFGFIESGFSWPYISPSEREIDLKFSEQGPHFLSAEV